MKLAALLSGGKDSLYAAYQCNAHEIKYVISVISENPESYMFHVPNIHLVEEQASLMGIPYLQAQTKGEKEKELDDLRAVLQAACIDGVVTGAVASRSSALMRYAKSLA